MNPTCKAALILLSAFTLAVSAGAQTVALVPIASNLSSPIHVADPGDGSGRLFIVEQAGMIKVFDGAQVLPTPFLDIRGLVSCCGERGLLSMAFHPDYQSNGFFYVDYTDNSGDTVVARYSVSGNPNVANVNSAFTVLAIPQDSSNHNGGQLEFGPDDYLYVGMGDGGGSGDPNNRGQSINTLLGKILRIDVDSGSPYAIPPDNPYVGGPGEDEIWATGLRNPWRFTFDRLTGDMFIGDVGQGKREEIDFQPADSTGCENYGWRRMEASLCFNPASNCEPGTPTMCNPTGALTKPILEYEHTNLPCDSVTGGYRYRGSDVPSLDGLYIYADYCRGTIWVAEEFVHEYLGPPIEIGSPPPSGPPAVVEWIPRVLMNSSLNVASFGEDADGELYVVDLGGTVYRITSPVLIAPQDGSFAASQTMDLVVRVYLAGVEIDRVDLRTDGELSPSDHGGGILGHMPHGGKTLRFPDFGRRLGPGRHTIEARVVLRDGRRFTATAVWRIEANTER